MENERKKKSGKELQDLAMEVYRRLPNEICKEINQLSRMEFLSFVLALELIIDK